MIENRDNGGKPATIFGHDFRIYKSSKRDTKTYTILKQYLPYSVILVDEWNHFSSKILFFVYDDSSLVSNSKLSKCPHYHHRLCNVRAYGGFSRLAHSIILRRPGTLKRIFDIIINTPAHFRGQVSPTATADHPFSGQDVCATGEPVARGRTVIAFPERRDRERFARSC